MKINCILTTDGEFEKNKPFIIDVVVDNASLIAELESRRPCNKCVRNGNIKCGECLWDGVVKLHREDYFKEKK